MEVDLALIALIDNACVTTKRAGFSNDELPIDVLDMINWDIFPRHHNLLLFLPG